MKSKIIEKPVITDKESNKNEPKVLSKAVSQIPPIKIIPLPALLPQISPHIIIPIINKLHPNTIKQLRYIPLDNPIKK